jgi:exodeoxyribonuclease-3
MKIATWNVNSLKVRLGHLLEWLGHEAPDVVCLQETKTEDAAFPAAAIEAAGYQVAFSGQKTYNGVAIVSRLPMTDVVAGIPGYVDEQKRVLSATVAGMRIVCAYIPNGQSVDADKYQYKLQWLAALTGWLRAEIAAYPRLALLGDYNIAPEDIDVHDPAAWAGQVLCSVPERDAFRGLIALGLTDSFRRFPQPERSFTWWDYRMNAFRRKMGLRIDHILLSTPLAETCTACRVDISLRGLERPSDHAPVIAELA